MPLSYLSHPNSNSFGPNSSIEYPGSKTVDISNWVVTVIASLAEMTLAPTAYESQEAQYAAQAALEEAQNTFEFPEADPKNPVRLMAGEYSVHRLFAAISQTRWAMPVGSMSFVRAEQEGAQGLPVGPEGVTFAEWAKASPANMNIYGKVILTLQQWAINHETSAFFTLGMQVRVPRPQGELPLLQMQSRC